MSVRSKNLYQFTSVDAFNSFKLRASRENFFLATLGTMKNDAVYAEHVYRSCDTKANECTVRNNLTKKIFDLSFVIRCCTNNSEYRFRLRMPQNVYAYYIVNC